MNKKQASASTLLIRTNRKSPKQRPNAIDPQSTLLKIVWWPISRLVEYERNLRKHTAAAVDHMCSSFKEFGCKLPFLVRSSGEIVDGHLRMKAALECGMTDIPVILCDEWPDAKVKAFRLMVNRSATWADWDDELVSLELLDLREADFDLDLTGFEDKEWSRLLALQYGTAGVPDIDDTREKPLKPTSALGDMWLCGPHRLLCGDATDPQAVSRLLGNLRPPLMAVDPPQGKIYDPTWRKAAGLNNSKRMGKVLNDDRADWREAWALFPGDVAYVWHGALHASIVADSLESCGFEIRSQIIWVKPSIVIGRGHYHWQHEPCFYAVRGASHWNNDRTQSTVWQIQNRNQDAETIHSTQKPVECMRRPIVNNSKPGDAVYDPFCGSGTTIIACQQESRIALAMELYPVYVDVAVMRWQDLTGKQATLDGDGRTFDEIAQERGGGAA